MTGKYFINKILFTMDYLFGDNISKFESKHGEIKTPGQDQFSGFGVKPPKGTLPN